MQKSIISYNIEISVTMYSSVLLYITVKYKYSDFEIFAILPSGILMNL